MPGQTKEYVTKFDPCAVGLVNKLCKDAGAKIVVHSSWRKFHFDNVAGLEGGSIKSHMMAQGLEEEYFHEDLLCPFRFSSSRWHDINEWLEDHEEVSEYVILEDEAIPYGLEERFKPFVVQVHFDEGLTWANFTHACDILSVPKLGDLVYV
jgi:hypothetical protein